MAGMMGRNREYIVNALSQIGVIVDVLQSAETENICLYIRFVHNLGNARSYDMLELSPGQAGSGD